MSEEPVQYQGIHESGGEIRFGPSPGLIQEGAQEHLNRFDHFREQGSPFTLVTDGGLAMYDHLPPAEAVYTAWSNPGPYPDWHAKMQRQVAALMPVLARALDRWEAVRNG